MKTSEREQEEASKKIQELQTMFKQLEVDAREVLDAHKDVKVSTRFCILKYMNNIIYSNFFHFGLRKVGLLIFDLVCTSTQSKGIMNISNPSILIAM